MNLINEVTGEVIVQDIIIADSFLKRFKGLMFKKHLDKCSGMLLHPCNQIHTFNMRFSLDVVYLDINNTILFIDKDLSPSKILARVKDAVTVIELNSGRATETNLKVGQCLRLVK